MPKIRLTKTNIDNLTPREDGKQELYWDAEVRGFGVLVSGKTKGKTYIVQREINGRTRRVTIGQANVFTVEQARDRAFKLLGQMADGIDPKAKQRHAKLHNITLKQALDSYLETKKSLRAATIKDYKYVVGYYLKDWHNKPLRDITLEMVEKQHKKIQKQVAATTKIKNAHGYSAANKAMRALRVIWNHAKIKAPDLPDNPVTSLSKLDAWFPTKRRVDMVRPDDMPAFYEAVMALENEVQRDYVLLLLFTGMRRREASALKWSEVDFKNLLIALAPERTKANRHLDIPMSDFVLELLTKRREIGLAGDWVFPANSKSGHIEEPAFALNTVREASGIRVSVHGLRRTFVTIAESCDIPAYALKGLVNHSLGSDVTAGYIIVNVERLREPMEKVAERLKELCKMAIPTPYGKANEIA